LLKTLDFGIVPEMAKEESAHDLLTNCPSCILFLEQGRELMQE